MKRKSRLERGLTAVVALALLGGVGGPSAPPCWAAKNRAAGADAPGAAVSDAAISQGDLRWTNLRGAKLSGVTFPRWTLLTGADLTNANLQGASLDSASLNSAHLRRVNLRQANLHSADLMNSDLRRADLRAANLQAADFWSADLRDANLDGARYDAQTRWPEGFDPVNHGAIIVPAMAENPPSDAVVGGLCIAALFFVVGGLVTWATIALQTVRSIGTKEAWDALWRGGLRVFLACVVFGAAYGMTFGSLFGLVLWLPDGDGVLRAVTGGALDGTVLGAFGGGVAGFAESIISWRLGWTPAAVLGSAVSAACAWTVICIAAGWEPSHYYRELNLRNGALCCSGVILVGVILGMALDRALRRDHSIVPGVHQLASIINGRTRRAWG